MLSKGLIANRFKYSPQIVYLERRNPLRPTPMMMACRLPYRSVVASEGLSSFVSARAFNRHTSLS
jgi:hypothetical protein